MKKSLILITSFMSISLCGCFNKGTVPAEKVNLKTVNDVLCSLQEDGVKNTQQISYEVVEEEELLPYFTLEGYFDLLNDYVKDGWTITTGKSVGGFLVTVSDPENNPYYVANISTAGRYFQGSGDMSYAFTTEKDLDKSSMYAQYRGGGNLMGDITNLKKFYYTDLDFTIYSKDGETYFPLSLLEINFASMTSVHHLYNYKRLVQYTDAKQLDTDKYLVDGQSISAYEEMNKYVQDVMKDVMPLYLRKDRQASFLFIMENLYGLKQTRNISSMKEYFEKQAFFADFLSENSEKRREAYCKTFELLDDGHTAIRDSETYPWYKGTINSNGPKIVNMINLSKTLTPARIEAGLTPGQVYYSTDGKLAFFTFDSFTFTYDAYEEDGTTLKTSLSDYNSEDFDSYFYIARLLKEIKEKGGVEDVVIDISTNGGGTIGVLVKILALMSNDNMGTIYAYSDVMHAAQSMYCSVDSNGDGEYDLKDCYGSDFAFHLLTSSFSFSCANLFPFAAKYDGIASIIGERSGGGECAIQEAYLPSGEHFYHSSNMHIGWYAGSFIGDEGGTPVDIPVEYADFYNLDRLQTIINDNEL